MIGNIPLRIFLPNILLPFSISTQDVVTLFTADRTDNTYQLIEESYGATPCDLQDELLISNNDKEIDISYLDRTLYILTTSGSYNSSVYQIIKQ
ncbi:hypothetical protein [uncultured Aquimarina sp.]|uniref:hypothetical protein n=1 Tax=uncultured Aquimarina sp. TaxID=575652 RepID=UPI00260BE6EB|nr:hypothetical protein [uncultured Aquimarina sp.]